MSQGEKPLNEEQRIAVEHGDGPLLIVAGAGTGKTTVLTHRYAHLLKAKNLKTHQIAALTFTEKAAEEMEDRVIDLLPAGAYDFWISTFHGFCQRILETHALEIGLPNRFRIVPDTDAWLLMKRRFDELPLDHYRPLGNPMKFLREILTHISRAKDEGISPAAYIEFAEKGELHVEKEFVEDERKRLLELGRVYEVYQRILREEACLDFGDVILETLRLFRERPVILAEYQKQFQYLFVDEFQDTNWAQYELLKMLAGDRKNITVVGDDDQSIYKFRGASLANILQFRDDFPDARPIVLTKNYRSRKEILDSAYAFIQHNDPNRLEVQLKDIDLKKSLEAMTGDGGELNVLWPHTLEDEADAVAEDIRKRATKQKETSWNDFAILVRSNDGAEPFLAALERQGIPFQFFALRGLYTKPVVLDVSALLHLPAFPHDSTYMWRALHLPSLGIPSGDIAELIHYANRKGHSLWSSMEALNELRLSDNGKRRIQALANIIRDLQASAARERPLKLLQIVLDKSRYLAYVLSLEEKDKRESLHMLNAFAERVRRYEQNVHDPSLRGFLDEYDLELESGEEGAIHLDPDSGPELVKVMTVHAAKGLEFEHVYVVSLVDQRFPTRERRDAIPLPEGLVSERLPEGDWHIEEERRLFYVAMTRAKQSLTLSGAKQYGGVRAKKPSLFLEETKVEIPELSDTDADPSKRLAPATIAPEPIMERELFPLKRRFSFTQLAAFKKCPLQYKYEHVYRIPKFGNFNKSFGQSVHLAFQRMMDLHVSRVGSAQRSLFETQDVAQEFKSNLLVTSEEAYAIYDDSWIDEWFPDRAKHDECYAKGKQAIAHLLGAYREQPLDVAFVEKGFTLVLGQHSIMGKIDRIDQCPDGTFAIYDYKTGDAKTELDADAKEQLHLYQIAMEELGMKVSKLAYIYVLDWVVTEVPLLSDKKREQFIEKVTERMDDLLLSDFQPTPSGFVCKYCDFRNICEFKK